MIIITVRTTKYNEFRGAGATIVNNSGEVRPDHNGFITLVNSGRCLRFGAVSCSGLGSVLIAEHHEPER